MPAGKVAAADVAETKPTKRRTNRSQHPTKGNSAEQLVMPGEGYTFEQFDGDCPQCAEGVLGLCKNSVEA